MCAALTCGMASCVVGIDRNGRKALDFGAVNRAGPRCRRGLRFWSGIREFDRGERAVAGTRLVDAAGNHPFDPWQA